MFQFCTPTLADGRDLLYEIIPKTTPSKKQEEQKEHEFVEITEESGVAEWRPSMNLFDLINQIPVFISNLLDSQNKKDKSSGP